ncbi:hypothetical protein Ctha_2686 [Chloroherpeton thalassium ATCC 35110]|uniref:Uncharacterized protein n=1 Tax=Chloroherpeton thalassium (strain ATCC 35110 / GB-78) TaxID=517418 RepID=B3QYR2_CHLT3|nr:hypothetical protein [Chloroherpeton thalassium]ACF15135.1 hypothetical protein Ctha_2686 [Chloroherpeton thalassium ATCC 35110]
MEIFVGISVASILLLFLAAKLQQQSGASPKMKYARQRSLSASEILRRQYLSRMRK